MGVLGVGFSQAPAGASDSVVRDSIFMVTELCRGGSLREKVLEQMIAGRKVLNPSTSIVSPLSLAYPEHTKRCPPAATQSSGLIFERFVRQAA